MVRTVGLQFCCRPVGSTNATTIAHAQRPTSSVAVVIARKCRARTQCGLLGMSANCFVQERVHGSAWFEVTKVVVRCRGGNRRMSKPRSTTHGPELLTTSGRLRASGVCALAATARSGRRGVDAGAGGDGSSSCSGKSFVPKALPTTPMNASAHPLVAERANRRHATG